MLYSILSRIKQNHSLHILGVADFYEFLRLNSTNGLDQGYLLFINFIILFS